MALIETEETNQFTFEAFAAHTFYTEVNRSLVRHALASLSTRPPNAQLTIVDMACGTGAVTRLIAEEIARQGRQAYIIGVDPSAEALRCAEKSMEEIQAKGTHVIVDFAQGEASDQFISSPINSPHFGSWLTYLLPKAYLRVIAPFTTVPTSRGQNDSIVCGHGAQLVGCARNTRKYSYHASQKQRPCSSLTAMDTFACSEKADSAMSM